MITLSVSPLLQVVRESWNHYGPFYIYDKFMIGVVM